MSSASVVIPTRNRRDKVDRAIRSVCAQTLDDWELIVVDDASSDDTFEFLQTLDDPRIRAVRMPAHSERSAARNHGLEIANSPAVLFLDDDDELFPFALELLTRALRANPGAVAAVGAPIHEIREGRRRASFPNRPRLVDVELELLAGWVALGGQSLIRTRVLKGAGGWRKGLSVAEDQELWLRLCGQGRVAIVPDAVLLHRPHGLEGDAPGHREVERGVVAEYLQAVAWPDARLRRAAEAREHLRDAHILFALGRYQSALTSTLRGIASAPFLLRSPLVGPLLLRGLLNATVTSLLPRAVAGRLHATVTRRRASVPA